MTKGRAQGEQREASRFVHTPGSLEEESILVAATAFLFAEGVEMGTSIVRHAKGVSTFRPHAVSMTMGCSTS